MVFITKIPSVLLKNHMGFDSGEDIGFLNQQQEWHKAIFHALCAAYALVSLVALVMVSFVYICLCMYFLFSISSFMVLISSSCYDFCTSYIIVDI